MADNLIKVVFEADTSSLKQGFKDVNDQLSSVSATPATKDFGKGIEEGAKKASGGLKEASESMGLFHKAGEAAQEKVKEFGGELLKFGAASLGIGSAFEVIKHSLDLAMEAETFHAQMTNILGDAQKANTVALAVEDISGKLAVSEGRVEASVKTLVMHGMASEKATELVDVLGASAKATGGSMEDLVDIAGRIAMKSEEGVISARELNRLVAGLGPEFEDVRKEYEGMDLALKQSNEHLGDLLKGYQRIYELQDRGKTAERLAATELREDSRKVEAREKAAKDTFSEKTGETKHGGDEYQYWLQHNYIATTRQAQSAYTDSNPMAKQKRTLDLMDRMEKGSQYLAELTGRSQGAMDKAVISGEYKPEDLLKAYDEKKATERTTGDISRTRGEQAGDLATREARRAQAQEISDKIESDTRTEPLKKRAMAETILDQVISHRAETEKKADLISETSAGKMQALGIQIDSLKKSFGDAMFIMAGSAAQAVVKGDVGAPGMGIPGLAEALKLMAQQVKETADLHQTIKQAFGQ